MEQLLKQLSLVCLCLFALTGQVMADPLANAQRAFNEGDFAKAAKLFKPLAKKGNVLAQLSLGEMYANGQGVPQDDEEAEKWYRMAAEQGNSIAQSYLGWMYSNGQGVPLDIMRAYMWFSIASANETNDNRKKQADDGLKKMEQVMTDQQIAKAKELARKCTASKFKGC
jgi:hypothetical protein